MLLVFFFAQTKKQAFSKSKKKKLHQFMSRVSRGEEENPM